MPTRPRWKYEEPDPPKWEEAARLSAQARVDIVNELAGCEEGDISYFLNCCASAGWDYQYYTGRAENEPRFEEKKLAVRQVARQARSLREKLKTISGTRYYFDRLALCAGRRPSFVDDLAADLDLFALIAAVAETEVQDNKAAFKRCSESWPPDPERVVAERVAEAYCAVVGEMPTITAESETACSSLYLRLLRLVLVDLTGRPQPDTTLLSKARYAVNALKQKKDRLRND